MDSDFGSGITIGTGVMTCTLTADPTQVDYDKSKMILTITPTKLFPVDTIFSITIPKNWPRSAVTSAFNQIINVTSQPNCLAISSNVQSSIGCSISSSSVIFVTVTNVLPAMTTSPVTFSLSQIRNPPTI
jgi:hypothetical protein